MLILLCYISFLTCYYCADVVLNSKVWRIFCHNKQYWAHCNFYLMTAPDESHQSHDLLVWICVAHFIAVHPVLVKIFHSTDKVIGSPKSLIHHLGTMTLQNFMAGHGLWHISVLFQSLRVDQIWIYGMEPVWDTNSVSTHPLTCWLDSSSVF